MKTSKAYSFILWGDSEKPCEGLPQFIAERVRVDQYHKFFHFILHKPEDFTAPILTRTKVEKPKYHYHCVIQFRVAQDVERIITLLVKEWAVRHPEYGECPFTVNTAFDGKCNNVCAFLAYVKHDRGYLQYLEYKLQKPESFKTEYLWDDIQSTNDELLEAQLQQTIQYIDQCERKATGFSTAREIGLECSSLAEGFAQCRNEMEMRVMRMTFHARREDGL